VELSEAIPRARAALAAARAGEAERIAEAVEAHRVVGVIGEAEVGKTETIQQALRLPDADLPVVRLDLDGAASDDHVGFLLAKKIARTVLGQVDHSMLSAGVLLPPRVQHGRLRLAEMLGVDGLDEALREWPSGHYQSTAGLRALETLAQQRDLVLWIDHVEAPRLTPRHPLKIDRLLWAVRELSQREPRLRVVVSAREGLQDEILGPRAAFHQQGQWLSLDVPAVGTWREVAGHVDASAAVAERLASLTGGHPPTMLLALLHLAATGRQRPPHAEDVLRELAVRDDGLAARAVQHARSLHRLGGQVLTEIALGQRPYAVAQRGNATPQEIRKVLNRLRLAGLLRRRDGWAIVNPLLAIRLRGAVRGPLGVDDEDADEG
jgi:hypothetical protein